MILSNYKTKFTKYKKKGDFDVQRAVQTLARNVKYIKM